MAEGKTRPRITLRKVAVNFPADLHAKIVARAAKEKRSFSDQAIELCKCGELCLADSDQHERETS